MNNKVRAYTEKETREQFLEHIHNMVNYWNNEKVNTREALDGLAFSILATLDGESGDLPGFRVTPICPEEDKKYLQENGENYYDEGIDIAGCLHEYYNN